MLSRIRELWNILLYWNLFLWRNISFQLSKLSTLVLFYRRPSCIDIIRIIDSCIHTVALGLLSLSEAFCILAAPAWAVISTFFSKANAVCSVGLLCL
jgi:hypothetical protein